MDCKKKSLICLFTKQIEASNLEGRQEKKMIGAKRGIFVKAYWLLDERFDFLIGSFLAEYKIDQEDFVIVSSHPARCHYEYHYLVLSDSEFVPDAEEYLNIEQIEPEDLNRRFVLSGKVTLEGLNELDEGNRIFIAAFTGAGLPIHERIVTLTSTGLYKDQLESWYGQRSFEKKNQGAALINDKKWQMDFFNTIGETTGQNTVFCSDEEQLKAIYKRRMRMSATHKIVIKPRSLSGGFKIGLISLADPEDVVDEYLNKVREVCKDGYLINDYVDSDYSYSGAAVINRRGEVRFLNIINEQHLVDGFKYGGLIYPANYYSEKVEGEIKERIKRIGSELAKIGYVGFFNVDFLTKEDKVYVIEINARICFCTFLLPLLAGQDSFWSLLRGHIITNLMSTEGTDYNLPSLMKYRILLGKLKLEEHRLYRNLVSKDNIIDWWLKAKELDNHDSDETIDFETICYASVGDDLRISMGNKKLLRRKYPSVLFDYGSCLGLYGKIYPKAITREKIKMQASHYHNKYIDNITRRILFMYVENSFGFKKQSFNYSMDCNISVTTAPSSKYILTFNKNIAETEAFFWGDNISGMTLLVGDNGTGKSLGMQLMCRWVDLIAANTIPDDDGGVLVFQDGETIRYIGFANGKEQEVRIDVINDGNLDFQKETIKSLSVFLKERIRVVYYSNGAGEDFDFSKSGVIENRTYINRLRESNKRYRNNRDVYRNYRYNSFSEQIDWACDLSVDFPLAQLAVTLDENLLQETLPEELKTVTDEIDNILKQSFENQLINRLDVQFLRHVLIGYISYLVKKYMTEISDNDVKLFDANIKYNLRNTIGKVDEINSALCEILKNSFFDIAGKCHMKEEDNKEIRDVLMAFCGNYSGKKVNNWFKDCWERSYLWSDNNTTWIYNLNNANDKNTFYRIWETFKYFENKIDSISFSWRGGSGELLNADLFTAWMPKSDDNRTTWIISDISEGVFDPRYQRLLVNRFVKWADEYYIGRKIQAWVMGYTPFIISDFPDKAVLYFEEVGESKVVGRQGSLTFAQNFYQLIRDSFKLTDGIIGEYATDKIDRIVEELHEISKEIKDNENSFTQVDLYDSLINYLDEVIGVIAEPYITWELKQYLEWGKQKLKTIKTK